MMGNKTKKQYLQKIPTWIQKLGAQLVHLAEITFPGARQGKKRKKWVHHVLREAMRAHDIKWLHDGIESALEDAI